MTNRFQDLVLGATLVVLAVVWTWLVIDTIPPGFGDGEIGARAFPLAFGIILLALAALLILRQLLSRDGIRETDFPENPSLRWMPALVLLAEIGLYGFLLEKIGFVLATPVIILLVMLVNLRVRSLKKLLATALCLTVGCWVIFEKVLGIYLANGTWINLG